MTDKATLGQNVPNMAEGLYLMDGIKGLLSLPQHSVDMLLTDPPYGTTRNYWDVPLPLPELWEAVKWAVKPNGAVLFFAQCPYDKVLGASNLSMLRYEWVWYKERGPGFLNANRAPLKKSENILVFYQKSPELPEGLFLMDGIEGLRSLPRHSVDMLLTDPPYGTTRNFWDVPLPLPELWEAVKWAVKPEGAVLFFAQCPYDKVLGTSNLAMLRYEWVWYKSRCTGFLNARRAPLNKTENILVFYQKSPAYFPQFEQGKPYKKIHRCSGSSPNYGEFERTSGESDGRRFPGNVLAFPTVTTTVHPTQKPVALCEYLIRTYTRPGEVVADICAGSGTTAVAALNTGRRFVCFETAPAFYGPATERIRRAREAVASGGKGE